jgi:hypothetical protein
LTVESRVEILAKGLCLDRWLVDLRPARTWAARPSWNRIRKTIQGEVQEKLMEYLGSMQIEAAIDIPDLPKTWTLESASTFSSKIAGLGPGLTPSGDDFLMGLLHAVWLAHPGRTASRIAGWILEAAAPRTTTLSAAWLTSAAKGEAGASWHELLSTMEMSPRSELAEAVQKILKTGHTSGADALAGFIAGLKLPK